MADQDTARVALRHHTLAEAAAVEPANEHGGDTFIHLADPPPVGSVLHLDGERAVTVLRVVETGGSAGVHVRDASDAEAESHLAIGTERLGPSNIDPSLLQSESDITTDAGPPPETLAAMGEMGHAVPAPVTEPDPSGPLPQEGGAGGEFSPPAPAEPEPVAEEPAIAEPATGEAPVPEPDPEPEPASAQEVAAEPSSSPSRGKRRKGRRRK